MIFARSLAVAAFLTSFLSGGLAVYAQESLPTLPTPIQNLVNEGAQIRYLGDEYGMDAWVTIKGGQEQYFYVKPDKSAFVMGLLYNDKGELVTMDQVQRLRSDKDGELLDMLAEEVNAQDDNSSQAFKTPAERLFADVESSNWVRLGDADAPVVYSFIDPQCPHCHAFIQDVLDKHLFKTGKLQIRLVPVGFKEETKAQAAFLMATPNPMEHWLSHMEGDKDALPAKAGINQQGVERNVAIMRAWDMAVTPLIVYRGRDGSVKLVRGRPKDMDALIADLPPRK